MVRFSRSWKAVKGKLCKDFALGMVEKISYFRRKIFMNTPLQTGSDPHSAVRAGLRGKAPLPARAASQVRLGCRGKAPQNGCKYRNISLLSVCVFFCVHRLNYED